MNRSEELQQAAQEVQSRIERACLSCGRNPRDVQLIWVSKTHPASDVMAALVAGAEHFGENKVQEALTKFEPQPNGATLHIIGPIQSNKLRKAANVATWIHSVDRKDHLEKLSQLAVEFNKTLQILFQVNTSAEESKSGIPLEEAWDFLTTLEPLPGLIYRGLMTIGPASGSAEDARPGFQQLRQWRDSLLNSKPHFAQFDQLSMGMSGDLDLAIAEGSTMIRVGTALFGARDYTARA